MPILYSFRRCPYAMRARLALYYAKVPHEHREIILKDKPEEMLRASPKATVPVLITQTNQVIDESLDIMLWAISQEDPDCWLPAPNLRSDIYYLIERNDTTFKHALDRYKYPNRYPDEDCTGARESATKILSDLNMRIEKNGSLSGDKNSLADMAIFPFIRQFAHVDRDWFYQLDLPHLHKWLQEHLTSALFKDIMQKHEKWTPKNPITYINN